MSWLPIEKLTTEEKDIIQDFNKKKTTLHELDKISKEINKGLQEREAVAEEARREEQLLKHKEEIKGIVYDIKRLTRLLRKKINYFLIDQRY